jgi:predicted DNA-binding transcriptional regulator AlpA
MASNDSFARPLPGLVRLHHLVGRPEIDEAKAAENRAAGRFPCRPRTGIAPLVPVSAATVWRWVKEGKFPEPVRIGSRITAWKAADVQAWLAKREINA